MGVEKQPRDSGREITKSCHFLAPSAFALASFAASWLFKSARHVFPHSTPPTSPGYTVMSHNSDCCGNRQEQGFYGGRQSLTQCPLLQEMGIRWQHW